MELTTAPPSPAPEAARLPARDAAPAAPAREPAARLTSLDAFRGFTMLFMASEILRIPAVARGFPDSPAARVLADLLDHKPWVGASPWDLIQPSFMFMVGVALPFSVASRRARGDSLSSLLGHTVWRALLLVLLGVFLRSTSRPQTYWTFEDVLTQIGLGYVFLFLLAFASMRAQWLAAGAILVGYWAAFALYPLPPAGFDPASVGVPPEWPHRLSGFAAHWDKNTNLAMAADRWFLNLFPRESPFLFNRGGYATLNFVPSLATMIFGLLAGGLLRGARPGSEKARLLVGWGVAGIALGLALHALGVCPLVKRIWTPSWAVFSAGWAAIFLAAFYWAIDLRGHRRWAFPLLVVGMNSIAMYVLVHVAEEFISESLHIHLGQRAFEAFGTAYEPVATGAATLLVLWLVLLWMYRRRIFLRI